jgi:cyclin-dependent kinase 2
METKSHLPNEKFVVVKPSQNEGELIENRYLKKCVLGEGTYGVVYMAEDKKEKKIVAIKKIRLENEEEGSPSTTLREISTLKELEHPNIIKIENIIYEPIKKKLYLVFEYIKYDLRKYLKSLENGMETGLIKSFMKQLLEGLLHCHSRRILHRDLKPQNILINPDANCLKIADFGLARAFSVPIRELTHEIETLWYRSPELLLGIKQYDLGVDTWPIGCIFAEMYLGYPLFMGDSEIDQIFKIFNFTGTPTNENWPGVEQLPYYKKNFPKFLQKDPSTVLKKMDPKALNLLMKLLEVDPCKRISAIDALKHSFFN